MVTGVGAVGRYGAILLPLPHPSPASPSDIVTHIPAPLIRALAFRIFSYSLPNTLSLMLTQSTEPFLLVVSAWYSIP